jgi:hypothetical protein
LLCHQISLALASAEQLYPYGAGTGGSATRDSSTVAGWGSSVALSGDGNAGNSERVSGRVSDWAGDRGWLFSGLPPVWGDVGISRSGRSVLVILLASTGLGEYRHLCSATGAGALADTCNGSREESNDSSSTGDRARAQMVPWANERWVTRRAQAMALVVAGLAPTDHHRIAAAALRE